MEIIHFFDINGEHKENVDIDEKKLYSNIDSPLRILNEYAKKNNLQPTKNNSEDKLVIEYKFKPNLGQQTKEINCNIIYNFSIPHQSALNSLGYIVFINLENN